MNFKTFLALLFGAGIIMTTDVRAQAPNRAALDQAAQALERALAQPPQPRAAQAVAAPAPVTSPLLSAPPAALAAARQNAARALDQALAQPIASPKKQGRRKWGRVNRPRPKMATPSQTNEISAAATNAAAETAPAPTGKKARLDQLLKLYLQDKVTPQQYHEQRAKILSEP